MLAVENRNSEDVRTMGNLFYYCCEELDDIKFTESLRLLMDTLKTTLQEKLFLDEKSMSEFLDCFLSALPDYLSVPLLLSYCES